jgi:hypothetical protein
MTPKYHPRRIIVGQPIPDLPLAALIAKINARNEGIIKILDDHAQHSSHPGHLAIAIDNFFARGGGKGKGGKGKGGSTGQKFPDPKVILAKVRAMFHGKPVAGLTGNPVLGEMNCEFGNKAKAKAFEDIYQFIYSLFHLIGLIEVDNDFVDAVAKILGYQGFCCTPNSRGQAVGFLVHPRFKVTATPISYDAFKNVQGIPDLRPAYRIDVEDTVTGKKYILIVVHPKSMLGGPKVTAAVRYQQFETLVNDLQAEIKKHTDGDPDAVEIIICGDLNFRLNKGFNDDEPLRKAGFQLVAPLDTRQTQVFSPDSRIDGFYILGSFDKAKFYDVHQYFKEFGRLLTDHAMTEIQDTSVSDQNTSPNDPQNDASDNTSAASTDSGADTSAKNGVESITLSALAAAEEPAKSGKRK